MVTFPNAKINIGLNIVNKRPDGYHNIESCFYPVPWSDVLEIIESETLTFKSTGIEIPGNPLENLCLKAYHLIRTDHDIPPVSIHLHKVIPIGAGLGGGSADGAFMLRLLNDKFELNISNERLEAYASKLGSDCPFFIQNTPRMARGTGNEFSELSLDLKGYHLVLIYPDIHVSTKEAYSGIVPKRRDLKLGSILKTPIEDWRDQVYNDFEDSIFPKHPIIKEVKDSLYQQGAIYASMTGSGATVFGLFEEEKQTNFDFSKHMILRHLTLV